MVNEQLLEKDWDKIPKKYHIFFTTGESYCTMYTLCSGSPSFEELDKTRKKLECKNAVLLECRNIQIYKYTNIFAEI